MPARTKRQQIIDRLEQGPATVSDLAALLELRVVEVVEHLEHICRSLRERKLVVEPAECTGCGMVFTNRSRFTAPSRCPRCRSERTTEPVLRIR